SASRMAGMLARYGLRRLTEQSEELLKQEFLQEHGSHFPNSTARDFSIAYESAPEDQTRIVIRRKEGNARLAHLGTGSLMENLQGKWYLENPVATSENIETREIAKILDILNSGLPHNEWYQKLPEDDALFGDRVYHIV